MAFFSRTSPTRAAADPRILLLYASFGSGHALAATALEESLQAQKERAVTVAAHDIISLSALRSIFHHVDMQRLFVSTGALYSSLWEHAIVPHPEKHLAPLLKPFFRGISRLVQKTRPDLILTTHALPAIVAARMIAEKKSTARLACISTDFMVHGHWPTSAVDLYCVATEAGRTRLHERQIPLERITVSGIPLRAQFARTYDATEEKKKMGVLASVPFVLLVAGSKDTHPGLYGKVSEELPEMIAAAAKHSDIQFGIMVGADRTLQTTLEHLATQHGATNVRIFGYTDAVAPLMEAADLLVTKPGGLISAEALAVGLPLLLLGTHYGQEQANAEYLLGIGAARSLDTSASLLETIVEIVHNPTTISVMQSASRSHGHPEAASVITQRALALLPSFS